MQNQVPPFAKSPAGSQRLRIDALEAGAAADAPRAVVELSDIRAWRFFRAAPQDFLEQYASGFIISDVHLAEGFLGFALEFLVRRPAATLWVRERISRRALIEQVTAARREGIACEVRQFHAARALKAALSDDLALEALAPACAPARAAPQPVNLLAAGPEPGATRFSASGWTDFFKRLWYEDLASTLRLRDRSSFFSFMKALSARTARPLNWAEIAAESGISAPTARDWTRHLESIGLCELIEPMRAQPPRRAKLRPKLYWTTPGLALWLSDEMTRPCESFVGALFENALYLSLKDALPQARFLHFADTNRITAPIIALEEELPARAFFTAAAGAQDVQAHAVKSLKSMARAGLCAPQASLVVLDAADIAKLRIEQIAAD